MSSLYDPIILLIEQDNKLVVSVASKRINKGDSSKSVIDEEYITNWIPSGIGNAFVESLKVEELSFKNLYKFYEDVIDRVKFFLVCEYNADFKYKNKKITAQLFAVYQKIKGLEESKCRLQRQIKKETDFAKQVRINVDIKKMKEKIDKLILQVDRNE